MSHERECVLELLNLISHFHWSRDLRLNVSYGQDHHMIVSEWSLGHGHVAVVADADDEVFFGVDIGKAEPARAGWLFVARAVAI